MVPLYTNYMTSAEYGTADLIFTIAQLLVSILSVVIFDAVIRFGLSGGEKRENVLFVGFIVLFFYNFGSGHYASNRPLQNNF